MTSTYKNISVHYTVSGKGRSVVLLHGFLENLGMWVEIAKVLSLKYKVICIDLLGHGKTESIGYIHTMEDQAKMVKFILNEQKIRKSVFIGHSMGGYVALAFAELFPKNVKGLCLLNSTPAPDDEEKRKNRDRAVIAVKKQHTNFVKLAIPNLFSEENRHRLKKQIDAVTEEALKTSVQGIAAALEGMKIREDRTKFLHQSDFPILVVISKNDPAIDVYHLEKLVRASKAQNLILWDGHMSHIENTQEVLHGLSKFCKEVYKSQ
ncbi:alpha/beta fold hydrolase [Namhaeicola litoreus]|uniref:Alpha/beta fold hydrolase n=1 Tax=Namhaeicola litoreus TaxID=1052145 RepID=A0ABW3XX50_9FLAO